MVFRHADRVAVKYCVRDATVHERIIIAHIKDGRYMILTPDGDFYEEDFQVD